jgi:hypothetical protein
VPSAIWLASIGSASVVKNQLENASWGWVLLSTGFSLSLAVNAIVTGLILFRIVKVYWEVEPVLYQKMLGATGGSRFRSIILVLIESAFALFAVQVILVVCSSVTNVTTSEVGNLMIGTHQMLLVSVHLLLASFYITNDEVWLGHNTYDYTSTSLNGIIFS